MRSGKGSTYSKRGTTNPEPGRGQLHAEPHVRPIFQTFDDETWRLGALYKISPEFEFGGHRPTPGSPQPKMWRFAESQQTHVGVATPPHPSVNK